MKKINKLLAAIAVLLLAFATSATAHVTYYDLLQSGPSTMPGYYNNGWYNGTRTTLGDSHNLNGAYYFKFTLAQPANVTLTFSDTNNTGQLNPAFSLYSGLLPNLAHDDQTTDPLNPVQFVITPAPHTVKLASPVDNGVTTDAQGYVSPFRDTANITYAGQFNALGDWSMANGNANSQSLAAAIAAGNWSVLKHITHVNPTGGNSVSLTNYYLPAGTYTVAAGGGNAVASGTNNFTGTLSLTVNNAVSQTQVPLPSGAFIALAAALSGLSLFFRKKSL